MPSYDQEIALLRKNAARYRWLRDEADNGEWECFDSAWLGELGVYGGGPNELDAAIDAEIAKQNKEPTNV